MLDLERQLRARDQKIEQLNQQMSRIALSMEQLTQVIDRIAVTSGETRTVAVATATIPAEHMPQPVMQPVRAAFVTQAPNPQPDFHVIREPAIIRLPAPAGPPPAVSPGQPWSR
jgi:hypothetical protein